MNKNTRISLRNGKTRVKQTESFGENSVESTQVVIEPRRSFWKSFSRIFKCSTKRRHMPDYEENGTQTPILETSDANVTANVVEDIDDMKSMLKKYSISPNYISMVQRIDDSKDVSKQSSLTGYVTDVSASSSDEEESAKKKVLLKNKINEFKHEIIREESSKRDETQMTTMKKTSNITRSSSMLTVDKDTYSFDYSESSQQSMADGNEDKAEKVMFDNNIKVKDENDIVTVDSINDASQHSQQENTDESCDEDLEENVNYDKLKHEDKVALIEEQYNIALNTVNKIEEQITAYSKHLESMRSRSSTDDITEQSLELENRDVMQNAMKLFGTKIMDNQGSNLLRHLHDMHQKHPETMPGNAVSLEEPAAKSKPMNMQMEYRRICGYECPHFTGLPSRFDDDAEEIMDTDTGSSESLTEVEVWSKDLNNVIKYIDRRDLPIFSKFDNCPVNKDGYKLLRLNSLFVAVAHPVTLKYRVVYDPLVTNDDRREHEHDDVSNLVTHKHKYMSLVQPEAMYEEDSMESVDKETYYTNEEKWENCTNESLTQENGTDVTGEDSDWKTVDLEENYDQSLTNTEDSHEEYVNQQNRYNLLCTVPRAATRRSNPPVEFKVTMRNPYPKENLVREYVAYRNNKNQVDKSTSYSSLPAPGGVELLYKNQDAQSEESASLTARNVISTTFRNINEDVEHMINDLLIDVSELKDGCMEITDGMCDGSMVELKQTSNGVIDKSSRISEALAQTILHEILEDVFYYSEEHVLSEVTEDLEMLHSEHDTEASEINDHDEDTLEGQYTYMRKDDRSKVFRNLNEVMQDLAQDTIIHQSKDTEEDTYEYCSSNMEEEYMQSIRDEKMTLKQVQSILQHMLQREANKHQNIDVEKKAKKLKKVHVYEHNSYRTTKKYPTAESVTDEQTGFNYNSPSGCNYHRFFNNNFSIKSGFIDTPNRTICNTCSNLIAKECTTDSGVQPDHFKARHDSDLLRYAQKQLRNPARRRSHHRIELPKYEFLAKRKNHLMVDKSTGNEPEMPGPESFNKNEVEQNIEQNLWSFEEAMRNLIRVNKKTAKLLKSSFVFPSKPNTDNSGPCCSRKLGENVQKMSKNTPENTATCKKSVIESLSNKSLTGRDQTVTLKDQSLTKTNQHLSENLEKILSNFSQQFSECHEKSNLK